MILKTKLVSSMEKVFCDTTVNDYQPLKKLTALKGESIAFQVILELEDEKSDAETPHNNRYSCNYEISGALKEFATIRSVKQTPVELPINPLVADDKYLRYTPGLYPDPLVPLFNEDTVTAKRFCLSTVWVEIDIPRDYSLDLNTSLTVSFSADWIKSPAAETLEIEVLNAQLPEQTLINTEWFYCDCIADYYDIPVWSEKHWEYVENFARIAHRNGMNMILTPILTPPLDTYIGGERTTVQLVDITVTDGKYSFDFSKVDRWVDMCNRLGYKYLEINHLYTQWGAKNAPKVMATVDGEYRRIFGWETDAAGVEYRTFLRQLLTELIEHLKKSGDDKRCYFHISDEPNPSFLERYKECKEQVLDILADYPIIDALSNYEFYKQGVVKNPIPCNDHIEPFIEGGVENLWTYYCCGQVKNVSNRFLAMPGARTRSMGFQMYRYNVVGFLQWGYNFYSTVGSHDHIDPFLEVSADYCFGAGDAYSVLPGRKGQPIETIRIRNFFHGIQDYEAMKLCESLCGKEATVEAIEKALGGEIRFDRCAHDSKTMLAIRENVNALIKSKI